MDGDQMNGDAPGSNPGGKNGIREDLEAEVIYEDEIEDIIDLGPDDGGEMSVDMDMLDIENEEAQEEEEEEEEGAIEINPDRDDSKVIFRKHTGSVFAVDTNDKCPLVVSGGEDDKAYVWNINTGENVLECTGHKDSVTCVSVSNDGKYVATGDLAGLVQVWSITDLKAVWSFDVADLEWLSWHPVAPVLLAGTVDGTMWMWKIPDGTTKTFQSFGPACNIGQVTPDGKRCVAGYEDGSLRVWDLKNEAPLHTFSGRTGHTKSITSMSCHDNDNNVITGSTDCTALLFNETTGKVAARFQCNPKPTPGGGTSSQEESEDSVESVGLCSVLPFAATGTLSGKLSIWDIPTQICRQTCKHDAGIVKLMWSAGEHLLYTCTLDGLVHLYDSRTGSRQREWAGHEAPILDMAINRAAGSIVTSSDDYTARVFSL